MAVGDKTRVSFVTQFNNAQATNVFYVEQTAGGDGTRFQELHTAILASNWLTLWLSLLSNEAEITCAFYSTIMQGNNKPTMAIPIAGKIGTIISDPIQIRDVVVVSMYSTEKSRRGQGNFRLSGVAETQVEFNRLSQLYKPAFINFIDEFRVNLIDAPDEWQFRHYSKANNMTYELIDGYPHTALKTLRSRQSPLCKV